MLHWLAKLFGIQSQKLGDIGEREAAKFLKKKGLRILARQHRNIVGEIDIIAQDGETIVFVEVKTRKSDRTGLPVESVTATKQKQIIRTTLAYLKRHHLLNRRVRFDIVGIIWKNDTSAPEVTHYENAFTSEDVGQMFS